VAGVGLLTLFFFLPGESSNSPGGSSFDGGGNSEMGNIADLDGMKMPSMEDLKMPDGPQGPRKASKMSLEMDMPDTEALDGMDMPDIGALEGMDMEAMEAMEAMEDMEDMEAVQLATNFTGGVGCTADIGTHTVYNTAKDPKEPWLNLRASSKSDSEVLAKMPDGTCLTLLSQNSSFWKVKVSGGSMDGTTGFASKNYMKAVEKAPEPAEEPAEAAEAAPLAAPEATAAPAAAPAAPAPAAVRTGRVKVRSKPGPNARIYVDGTAQGSAPSTLTLNEGSHQIKLVGKSGKEKTFSLRVNPSSPTSICWNFKKRKDCGN
jgi:hypothetical protein